ncbi:MAG: pilus assembly protein TadG-related protein [Nocardioides sp.]
MPEPATRTRGERGTAAPLIIGFALLLAMTVAFVVDASAAFLQRQGLDTLADGAALSGADAGAQGAEVYTGGLDDTSLVLTRERARAGVHAYLTAVGAYRDFDGLRFDVMVRTDRVVVTVSAPVDFPLTVPGAPSTTRVSATGAAVVDPQ